MIVPHHMETDDTVERPFSNTGSVASTESFADVGRGIRLCYQTIGNPRHAPLVLIAGLGQQYHSWPTSFCVQLAARGFRVIRFDNRDVGRSTHTGRRPPRRLALLVSRLFGSRYRISDMAQDTVGLLDALEIRSAHLVGICMGGMIAQTVASRHGKRTRSLASLMSTTGAHEVQQSALATWLREASRPQRTRQEACDRAVDMFRQAGSPESRFNEQAVRELAERTWDRDPGAPGVARQFAAILRTGDRTAELRRIAVPTLVVHGDKDRVIGMRGGLATARAIPGSVLYTVAGIGHDLPASVWLDLIDLIEANTQQE
ncbi:alpha/beta fold hydrolase [Nocardia nova]|uniref:alpha/beta fold hydrolase n=1 Tax=Nocardia nova TaxID=37330 RepID=UPI0033EEAC9A